MVMEYCAGGDLGDFIQRHPYGAPEKVVQSITLQLGP